MSKLFVFNRFIISKKINVLLEEVKSIKKIIINLYVPLYGIDKS